MNVKLVSKYLLAFFLAQKLNMNWLSNKKINKNIYIYIKIWLSINILLYEEYIKYGFCFIDNGAVWERILWKDGIYLTKSGKIIVAKGKD